MKTTAKERETLADVALRECGSIEAMYEIAYANGMSLSDEPYPGQELLIPPVYSINVVRRYKANAVAPASGTAENLPQNTVISSDGLSIVSILDGENIIY